LARVRLRTVLPARKDSRSKMAGGELRLGTRSIYMNTYDTYILCFSQIKILNYMGTNMYTILRFSHQINDIRQNRLRSGGKFGLTGCAGHPESARWAVRLRGGVLALWAWGRRWTVVRGPRTHHCAGITLERTRAAGACAPSAEGVCSLPREWYGVLWGWISRN